MAVYFSDLTLYDSVFRLYNQHENKQAITAGRSAEETGRRDGACIARSAGELSKQIAALYAKEAR